MFTWKYSILEDSGMKSDEILARRLAEMDICAYPTGDCPDEFIDHRHPECFGTVCKSCWLDWARKQAEESEKK